MSLLNFYTHTSQVFLQVLMFLLQYASAIFITMCKFSYM